MFSVLKFYIIFTAIFPVLHLVFYSLTYSFAAIFYSFTRSLHYLYLFFIKQYLIFDFVYQIFYFIYLFIYTQISSQIHFYNCLFVYFSLPHIYIYCHYRFLCSFINSFNLFGFLKNLQLHSYLVKQATTSLSILTHLVIYYTIFAFSGLKY